MCRADEDSGHGIVPSARGGWIQVTAPQACYIRFCRRRFQEQEDSRNHGEEEKVRQQVATEAYYREHYEVIIREQALQKLMLI